VPSFLKYIQIVQEKREDKSEKRNLWSEEKQDIIYLIGGKRRNSSKEV
jgi:hypothetical protein